MSEYKPTYDNYWGLNLPKTLRLLKQKAENDELRLVTCCKVKIKFSKEIAYFDNFGYYENPKFDEYWVKFNTRRNQEKYGNQLWQVAYCSKKLAEEEDGKQPTGGWVRYLICDKKSAIIGPQMDFWLVHQPDKFPTTLEACVYQLKCAMEECAKYCGGTVEFTYTDQIRIPFPEVAYKTLTLGNVKPKKNANSEVENSD